MMKRFTAYQSFEHTGIPTELVLTDMKDHFWKPQLMSMRSPTISKMHLAVYVPLMFLCCQGYIALVLEWWENVFQTVIYAT